MSDIPILGHGRGKARVVVEDLAAAVRFEFSDPDMAKDGQAALLRSITLGTAMCANTLIKNLQIRVTEDDFLSTRIGFPEKSGVPWRVKMLAVLAPVASAAFEGWGYPVEVIGWHPAAEDAHGKS